MNYYQQNIKYLLGNYPNIAPLVLDREHIPSNYSISHSKNNCINITVTAENRKTMLYSKYDPAFEVNSWVCSLNDQLETVEYVLLVGLGLGYHLEALICEYPNKKFYIYEPDINIFSLAMQVRDMRELLSHPSIAALAVGREEHIQMQFLLLLTDYVWGSYSQITLPIYSSLYTVEIESLNQSARTIVGGVRSNIATYTRFSVMWMNNIFENLNHSANRPNVKFLKNAFLGKTTIIVGSGPSLENDIEELRKIKGHTMIIAAGTSIQALLRHGIEPDLIVSIDGGEPNFNAFNQVDTRSIPLVFSTYIHSGIPTIDHKYMSYLTLNDDTLTPRLLGGREDSFESTYSVTGTCIQLAVYMGCNRIVLTGQDLSFPNNQYYSSGIKHVEANVLNQMMNSDYMVDNVHGDQNPTSRSMYVTLKDIELRLESLDYLEIINCSTGGANIKGTVYRPLFTLGLDQVEDSNNVKELFESVPQTHVDSIYIINRIEQDLTILKQLNKDINLLIDQVQCLERITEESILNAILEIDMLWNQVLTYPVFQVYINFGLKMLNEINNRYFLQIANESDLKKKRDLILKHIPGYLKQVVDFIPEVEQKLNDVKANFTL